VSAKDNFKKLLRPLGAIVGLTGAAALVNRRLRTASALPLDHIGGIRRIWNWRGYDIFVTELGAGPTVLLVHGVYPGASSFEFRKLAPLLARSHRVVAFDLVGCGLSELPDIEYNAELFVDQIVNALGEFADAPATLVGAGLGGAFCVRAAARAPERVRGVTLIAPSGLSGVLDDEPAASQRVLTFLMHSPIAGESAFNVLASKASLRRYLRRKVYGDPSSATPEVVEHIYAVAHQLGARYVPAHFVGGGLNCNIARDLPFVEAPVLVLWGERAPDMNPVRNAYDYVRLARDGTLETFPHSGLMPHEEEPDGVARAIAGFIGVSAHAAGPPAAESSAAGSLAAESLFAEPPIAESRVAESPAGGSPTAASAPSAAAESPASVAPGAATKKRRKKKTSGNAANPATISPSSALATIFKSYDVRGIYPTELNDELAEAIGGAFVAELGCTTIAVGRDMRPSGEKLFAAFARGANGNGADVVDIGLVSTDALYFAVGHYAYDGGVMITASHNPANYNGLKFTGPQAQAISLETGLAAIRDRIARGDTAVQSTRRGKIKRKNVLADFAAHCLGFIDPSAIKPFKIAIDAGNGMAGETVPHVFKHLPCTVIPLYFDLDGTFPNHPASPIEPENMVDLQRAVVENGCDLGAAFDGDADRMFIVDEKGGLVGGDMVTALVGLNTLKRHPGAKILYNLICSRSVPEAIARAGGIPIRSQVGHSIIKKIMREQDIVFGGEHSGHFYFRDNWFADSGMIALLQCLEVFSDANKPVSAVVAPLNTRFRSGEINSRVHDIAAKLKELEAHYRDAAIDHLDGVTISYPNWWMNVRPSNTEPLLRLNVEGDTRELMEKHRDEALAIIRS
jgi:phosphomannomutase